MVKTITYSNSKIYELAIKILNTFKEVEDLNLPVKINFYLQKNIDKIVTLGTEVENVRIAIIKKYGTPSEENPEQYIIPKESIDDLAKELDDLSNIEQLVDIDMLKLEWFDNIQLTSAQVAAIAFMIEEE